MVLEGFTSPVASLLKLSDDRLALLLWCLAWINCPLQPDLYASSLFSSES